MKRGRLYALGFSGFCGLREDRSRDRRRCQNHAAVRAVQNVPESLGRLLIITCENSGEWNRALALPRDGILVDGLSARWTTEDRLGHQRNEYG
jgi:hypothetical protein